MRRWKPMRQEWEDAPGAPLEATVKSQRHDPFYRAYDPSNQGNLT